MLKAVRCGLQVQARSSTNWPIHLLSKEPQVIKETIKEADVRMRAAIQNLEEDLATIRTGRASPALVERLQVEYYG